ncbi:UNVERIFIED_CONTAM: hypothetical protein HDU68_009440 [Siphonaria sp. JEL0065]|nr:hypothetical protein HDU68_009440 [Siphonaria sp. JEL0065]
MQRLRVDSSSFIVKSLAAEDRSRTLQLAREALFYSEFANVLEDASWTAKVYFTDGDMETGRKLIVLEDLSRDYVQSGYYFGNCSPHNWSKDLEGVTGVGSIKERQKLTKHITLHAFKLAATIHSRFWKPRTAVIEHCWLRGVDWMQGKGQAEWTQHQQAALAYWTSTRSKIADKSTTVKWNPHLVACMDASFAKVSWTDFQSRIQNPLYGYSLVHGDFHPANMMWKGGSPSSINESSSSSQDSLILLDWEVVGVGSGPQDCAQFVISHTYPEERRLYEDELIQEYYKSLIAGGVSPEEYSLQQCKSDYVAGGVSRWIWLLGYTSGVCPDDWVQFFHDQVYEFIVDHGVTPENIEMPRV